MTLSSHCWAPSRPQGTQCSRSDLWVSSHPWVCEWRTDRDRGSRRGYQTSHQGWLHKRTSKNRKPRGAVETAHERWSASPTTVTTAAVAASGSTSPQTLWSGPLVDIPSLSVVCAIEVRQEPRPPHQSRSVPSRARICAISLRLVWYSAHGLCQYLKKHYWWLRNWTNKFPIQLLWTVLKLFWWDKAITKNRYLP